MSGFPITHDEAQTVVLTKAAIAAMGALVMHLVAHPETLPENVRKRIVEADYMLNSSEDCFIVFEDQIGEYRSAITERS